MFMAVFMLSFRKKVLSSREAVSRNNSKITNMKLWLELILDKYVFDGNNLISSNVTVNHKISQKIKEGLYLPKTYVKINTYQ